MAARMGSKVKKAKKRKLLKQQGNLCNICSWHITLGGSTIDHIIPKSDGGRNANWNLQVLCKSCHEQKTREENKSDSNQKAYLD